MPILFFGHRLPWLVMVVIINLRLDIDRNNYFRGNLMPRKYGFISVMLLISVELYASQFIATGYGDTQELARSQSRAALSESLWVEIKSEFNSVTREDGQTKSQQKLSSFSEVPLLGASSECIQKSRGDYFCETILDTNSALKLYIRESEIIQKRLLSLQEALRDKKQKNRQYQLLTDIVSNYEKLQQFLRVIRLMGSDYEAPVPVDIENTHTQIFKLENSINDLSTAAAVVKRGLPDKSYFVYPPTPIGSSQATQFSKLFRDEIQGQLRSVKNLNQSDAYLKGHYHVLNDAMVLTYQAFDTNGVIIASRILRLHPDAYSELQYQTTNIDFETLLHEGYIVSNEFKAELNTNHGSEYLLFSTGEEIELFVKMNQPGYFYIVSHNSESNVSYLLEMNDAPGKRAFISYVNADDSNRWISLGKYEVVPPYGTEHLQLIASNLDLIDKLPYTVYDSESMLHHVVSKGVEEAVIKTRALKPVNRKKQKSAESSLTYTTVKTK